MKDAELPRVRIEKAFLEALRETADDHGIPLSEWIRRALDERCYRWRDSFHSGGKLPRKRKLPEKLFDIDGNRVTEDDIGKLEADGQRYLARRRQAAADLQAFLYRYRGHKVRGKQHTLTDSERRAAERLLNKLLPK